MQETLEDLSWTELFFGTAYLAAGSRGPRTVDEQTPRSAHGWRAEVEMLAWL